MEIGEEMNGYLKVVTNGKVFRIQQVYFGDKKFVSNFDGPLEFKTKEAAEKYIHNHLTDIGWEDA